MRMLDFENPIDQDNEEISDCKIMGQWGIIFQSFLGFLAFCVLICIIFIQLNAKPFSLNLDKRYKESPRRTWKIWILDTSKQLISAAIAHLLNLALALVLSEKDENTDQCAWYFITLAFDTTVGLFLSVLILAILEGILTIGGCKNFKSGNYFKEEISTDASSKLAKDRVIKIDLIAWSIQLIIWSFAVILAKLILYYIQNALMKPMDELCSLIFDGLDELPMLKLLIVLFIFPVAADGFQFWIVDNFLKKKEFNSDDERLTREYFEYDTTSAKANLKSNDHNENQYSFEIELHRNQGII